MHQNPYYGAKVNVHQRWDSCPLYLHIPTSEELERAFPSCLPFALLSMYVSGPLKGGCAHPAVNPGRPAGPYGSEMATHTSGAGRTPRLSFHSGELG